MISRAFKRAASTGNVSISRGNLPDIRSAKLRGRANIRPADLRPSRGPILSPRPQNQRAAQSAIAFIPGNLTGRSRANLIAMPLRRVLSGPAYWDGRMGRFHERNHCSEPRNPSILATWVWRVGHAQPTAIHFRSIKQHNHNEIVPGLIRCRLHVKRALRCTANRPPQIALISIETGYHTVRFALNGINIAFI